ncbi:MAG: CvpA family protein [Muribaculaceae bacterium]|nr:CvpA family protein [Muribaculaceae bacterium]
MSFIDILILIVFIAAVCYGLKLGLIRQLGSIAGLILGLIAARLFGDAVADIYGAFVPESFGTESVRLYTCSILGRVTVLVLVYAIVVLVARGLKKVFHSLLLGPVDRALGVVLALVQWFLGLSLVLNIFAALFPSVALSEHSQLAGGLALQAVMAVAPTLFGGHFAPWLIG